MSESNFVKPATGDSFSMQKQPILNYLLKIQMSKLWKHVSVIYTCDMFAGDI